MVFHPTYGLPPDLTGLWDGCLHFGSTETASCHGGYLEGALDASERLSKM
jgi:monoamine oxidase